GRTERAGPAGDLPRVDARRYGFDVSVNSPEAVESGCDWSSPRAPESRPVGQSFCILYEASQGCERRMAWAIWRRTSLVACCDLQGCGLYAHRALPAGHTTERRRYLAHRCLPRDRR